MAIYWITLLAVETVLIVIAATTASSDDSGSDAGAS